MPRDLYNENRREKGGGERKENCGGGGEKAGFEKHSLTMLQKILTLNTDKLY